MQGRARVGLAVRRLGLLGGVGAQQVVEGVAAGRGLGEQVAAGEIAQQRPGLRQGHAGQAGRGRGGDVGAGVEASSRNIRAAGASRFWYDQENTARTSVAASPVLRASRRLRGIAELGGQRGEREAGAGAGPGRGDGQGQREPGAQRRSARRRRPVPRPAGPRRCRPAISVRASASVSTSRDSGWAPSAATSPASSLRLVTRTSAVGVAGSSGRTWSASRALSSRIRARLSASRLRYRAWRPSRLAGISPDGTCSASRNPRRASAGATGVAGRVEPAQVHVQLAVGEPGGLLPGPVHGQRGLADPGGAADRRDHHRLRGLAGAVHDRGQVLQLPSRPVKSGTAAGSSSGGPPEPGRRPRRPRLISRRPGRAPGPCRARQARTGRAAAAVGAEDALVQLAEAGPGSMPISSTSRRRARR